MPVEHLNPEGWPRPSGYSNGTAAAGRMVFVAGQVGWHPVKGWESDDFVHQVRQCLENTRAVLEAGGARPEHIVRMTWYVTDKQEYLANLKGVGEAYRAVLGKVFPAMALVQVAALVEDRAKVEIETTAIVG
jgi:enamine deaminase RidA (YjgF/YER057c/UK114 family)